MKAGEKYRKKKKEKRCSLISYRAKNKKKKNRRELSKISIG